MNIPVFGLRVWPWHCCSTAMPAIAFAESPHCTPNGQNSLHSTVPCCASPTFIVSQCAPACVEAGGGGSEVTAHKHKHSDRLGAGIDML